MIPFYFEYVVDARPGDEFISAEATIAGLTSTSTLAVTNGLCRVNGGSWSEQALIDNDDIVELFGEAPKEYDKSARIRYSVLEDGFSAYWKISTARDAENVVHDIGIISNSNEHTSEIAYSNLVVVKGFNRRSLTVRAISALSGLELSINKGPWVTAGTINSGQTLQLRAPTSPFEATTNTYDFSIGINFFSWAVTTSANNTSYPYFYIPVLVLRPLSTVDSLSLQYSPPIVISELSEPLQVMVQSNSLNSDPLSISGNPGISVNGGAVVTTAEIKNGDRVQLVVYPSGLDRGVRIVTLYPASEDPSPINVLGRWVVRTEHHAVDDVADVIQVSPTLNQPPNIEKYSEIITVTGFDTDAVLESQDDSVEFRIRSNAWSEWGDWVQGWSVFSGTQIQLKARTPSVLNTVNDVVLRLNGVPIHWKLGSRIRQVRN